MRNLGPCACCGGVSECVAPYGLPTAYKVVMRTVIKNPGWKPINGPNYIPSCGCASYVRNEDLDASCGSINGTYVLNYGGQTTCHGVVEGNLIAGNDLTHRRWEGEVSFYYWMSSPFTISSPGDELRDYPAVVVDSVETCAGTLNAEIPTSYILLAARRTGGERDSNRTNGFFPDRINPQASRPPWSCCITLTMIPLAAISQRAIKMPSQLGSCLDVTNNQNICNAIYQMPYINHGSTAAYNSYAGNEVLLEDDCLSACYIGGCIFKKSTYDGKLYCHQNEDGFFATEDSRSQRCQATAPNIGVERTYRDWIQMTEIF